MSNNVDVIVNNWAEWNATINIEVEDPEGLTSNTATITFAADKKTPVYSSNTISGLDTQWQTFFNQTITVTDFSDLTWANIEIVDLFTNTPVGWNITNLRFSWKTVTFDGALPSWVEDVKIRASFTDEYGNTSIVTDVESLTLTAAPVANNFTVDASFSDTLNIDFSSPNTENCSVSNLTWNAILDFADLWSNNYSVTLNANNWVPTSYDINYDCWTENWTVTVNNLFKN